MTLETLFNFINGYWVGRLGTTALAAVNLSSFSVWMLFGLAGTVATGTNSLVAQRLGAGRHQEAQAYCQTGVWASLLLGLIILVPVQMFGNQYLLWQSGQGEDVRAAADLGATYLKSVFLFAPFYCLNETASAIMRAHGDTRTPLKLYAFGFGLNFCLDPLLILGKFGFPRYEVWGAALASGISFSLMAVLYIGILLRRGLLAAERPHFGQLGPILRIGIPPSLSSVFFCLVYMLVSPVVGRFGQPALAALGIGHRVESLGYLISYGMSLACITLVGQNVGAGNLPRARRAGWVALRLEVLAMLCVSTTMVVGAPLMARIFSDDPAVIDHSTLYLRLMALAQLPGGLSIVLQGVFSGAGRPLPVTLVSMLAAGLRWPLAHYFAIQAGHGVGAVWGVIVGLLWLQGIVTCTLFWRYPSLLFGKESA